jgi:hypothetical protein
VPPFRVRIARPPALITAGVVQFVKSPGHEAANFIGYEVRARAAGASTVIVAKHNIGRPVPNNQGVIAVDLSAFLSALPAGQYELSIAATDSTGTNDDLGVSESRAFVVPLA